MRHTVHNITDQVGDIRLGVTVDLHRFAAVSVRSGLQLVNTAAARI